MDYVKVLLLVMFGALRPVLCQSEPTAVSDVSGFHLELLLLHLAELESRIEELLSARMKELERNVVDACTQNMEHMVQNQTRHLEYVINLPAVIRESGWITIQHRFDGSVNFYRNWTEYKNGFGDVRGEFWLGLEKLYEQTRYGKVELLVVLENFDGTVAHAHYSDFRVGDEEENYVLETLGEYSGTAGDSLRRHEQQPFSTYDKGDAWNPGKDCARIHSGAWWFMSNGICMYRYTTYPCLPRGAGVRHAFFAPSSDIGMK
uniref:Fibrinogen C-terminal domain-containing protein n=1 Tax=Anopheles atroparvus TaxID=41427 RepID=A0A182J6G5_ANOAO